MTTTTTKSVVRSAVRAMLLTAMEQEVRKEIEISLGRGDYWRAECCLEVYQEDHERIHHRPQADDHTYYCRERFPILIARDTDGMWDIYGNADGRLACIAVEDGRKSSHFGDRDHIRSLIFHGTFRHRELTVAGRLLVGLRWLANADKSHPTTMDSPSTCSHCSRDKTGDNAPRYFDGGCYDDPCRVCEVAWQSEMRNQALQNGKLLCEA